MEPELPAVGCLALEVHATRHRRAARRGVYPGGDLRGRECLARRIEEVQRAIGDLQLFDRIRRAARGALRLELGGRGLHRRGRRDQ